MGGLGTVVFYGWVSRNVATKGPAAGETGMSKPSASETIGPGHQLRAPCVHLRDGSVPALGPGCGLRGSYAQLPAAGEPGIQV